MWLYSSSDPKILLNIGRHIRRSITIRDLEISLDLEISKDQEISKDLQI